MRKRRRDLKKKRDVLGVKRDAFVIERAPEEEVGQRGEGVEREGESRYDEKGEAHRSPRRPQFDSVLRSLPPPPVAMAWERRVSTGAHGGPSHFSPHVFNRL